MELQRVAGVGRSELLRRDFWLRLAEGGYGAKRKARG